MNLRQAFSHLGAKQSIRRTSPSDEEPLDDFHPQHQSWARWSIFSPTLKSSPDHYFQLELAWMQDRIIRLQSIYLKSIRNTLCGRSDWTKNNSLDTSRYVIVSYITNSTFTVGKDKEPEDPNDPNRPIAVRIL